MVALTALFAIHCLCANNPTDLNTLLKSIECMLHALQSEALTPKEQALGFFAWQKLKNLSTWPLWKAAKIQQLDQFHDLGMHGPPSCKCPPNAIVLPPHWQYCVTTNGTWHSQNWCDGSPCAAPALHCLTQTYASCIKQPCFCLSTALSTALLYMIYADNVCGELSHSPVPHVHMFLCTNNTFAEWYVQHFNKPIDCNHVLPIWHALQDHHPKLALIYGMNTFLLANHLLATFPSSPATCNPFYWTYLQFSPFTLSCSEWLVWTHWLCWCCPW